MRQLTSLDAQFLALENARTQGHVSVLGVYDANTASGRPLDAALVRELVTERMHLLPTFRWRLAPVPFGLDYPYWVDDGTFDVEYHVRELALPSPGNERQLAEQVADLIGRQLDRARPLWEVYVIHGLQDGAVAVLTKMHHAAVDGVSGAEVMSILLDDTAAGREFEPTPAVVGERFPSEVQMLGRGLVGMLRQPLRVLRAAPTTLPHLDDVATLRHLAGVKTIARSGRMIKRLIPAGGDGSALQGNDVVAPPTRFQTRISAHRRVAFGSVSNRAAQRRRVLALGAGTSLPGCGAARPAGRIGKGHNPSGRPDVPRERVGVALRRSHVRSAAGPPGAASRPRLVCSTCSRKNG